MAMTLCDKCGQAFNDSEKKCPKCGAKNTVKRNSRKLNKWFITIPIIILVLAVSFIVLKGGVSDTTESETELLEFTLQNGSKGYINPLPKVQNRWTMYFNAAIDALKDNGATLKEMKESDIKNIVSISDGRFYVPVEYIEWFNNGHNHIPNDEIQSFCQMVNSGNILSSSDPNYLNLYGEIQLNLDYELNRQRSIESLQQEISEMNYQITYGSNTSVEEITGYRVEIMMLQRILIKKGVNPE